MKKFLETLFWILTDALLVFGLTFLPSIFSIFCFIAAVLFAPIEEWQNLLKKFIKKPIKAILVSICIAFVIAEFPLARVVNGFYEILSPAPTSSNFIVHYEEPTVSSKISPSSSKKVTSKTSSKKPKNSNKASATSKKTSVSQTPTDKEDYTETSKEESKTAQTNTNETNGENVFRTPSGKRYHFSETCGGKNSYEISFEEAMEDNLTPCKKCAE